MASSNTETDLEAQTSGSTKPLPPAAPPTNTPNPQPPATSSAVPQLQATNTSGPHNENPPAPQITNNSAVQRGTLTFPFHNLYLIYLRLDENHGDSSDGLWSMYLTEAEKQDKEVTESWKGDTDGIIVFVSLALVYLIRFQRLIHISKTGLFSATVASFIIESLQNLSPDSSDTTNALLTQISQQLVNMSNGTPLTIVPAQSKQPFKPTASAVRVNVLWFLSLILSLSCALSATLMQQWTRRYQELAQRRGAFHRRGRMRAYIFDGINRFGMTRAVATMPTLLHISVFLFLAGLVDFLFPIYPTVAYATLGCIMVFALPYVILTVLPNIYLNCPYGTPLSAITWRISQFSVIVFLQIILEIRKSFSKIRSLANRQAPASHRLQKWREPLEKQVSIRQQWFSQGIRRSFELSAYRADSAVVTNALVWTLAALDEDKEVEDFAARIPGFFNSRVVQDATLAVLPLMSHEPNTYPIFGSRLYDLLKTCTLGTSVLDERMRKNRLRVCLNCLWYFGRAYNQAGVSQPLPSYFPNSLIPEITRRVQTEEDSGVVRVIGRCFEALIVNKLVADIDSRINPIRDTELACLSSILGIKSREVELYLSQPDTVTLVNMISFLMDEVSPVVPNTIPPDVLGVVQQTLDILSLPISVQESAELQSGQPIAIVNGSNGKFERILLSRLHDLLSACIPATFSHRKEPELRTSRLRICLKGLWYFGRAFNQLGNSIQLPSDNYIAFLNPEVTRHIRSHPDSTVRVIGYCVMALVVNKLAADINARILPASDAELACLTAILGTDSQDVTHLLSHPGAIQFANTTFHIMNNIYDSSWKPTSDVLDVVHQTFSILSRALPGQLDTEMGLGLIGDSKGRFELIPRSHSIV